MPSPSVLDIPALLVRVKEVPHKHEIERKVSELVVEASPLVINYWILISFLYHMKLATIEPWMNLSNMAVPY